MTYHNAFTDTALVLRSKKDAATQRAKWAGYFVLSWAFTITGLLGLLGDLIQAVMAFLAVIWFFSIYTCHKVGILPFIARFWLTVFRGR